MSVMKDAAAEIYKKLDRELSNPRSMPLRSMQDSLLKRKNKNTKGDEYSPMNYVISVMKELREYRESLKSNG
jgi:ATP-dependent Clp protease adapter protein ClpS